MNIPEDIRQLEAKLWEQLLTNAGAIKDPDRFAEEIGELMLADMLRAKLGL